MKLTKYDKSAIARSIINELPELNRAARTERAQQLLVKAMSPACKRMYKTNPEALRSKYFSSHNYAMVKEHLIVGDVANGEEVLAPLREDVAQREALKSKVAAAVESCGTRKQFVDRYPEFSKYAPSESGVCTTLPAVANLISDLVKAGWKQTISKEVS